MAENTPTSGYGYGKRPMWQWILIYAVVGGIVYFLIYYFVLAPKGGYTNKSTGGNYGQSAY